MIVNTNIAAWHPLSRLLCVPLMCISQQNEEHSLHNDMEMSEHETFPFASGQLCALLTTWPSKALFNNIINKLPYHFLFINKMFFTEYLQKDELILLASLAHSPRVVTAWARADMQCLLFLSSTRVLSKGIKFLYLPGLVKIDDGKVVVGKLDLLTVAPCRYLFATEAITVTGCLQSRTNDVYFMLFFSAETCMWQHDNFLPPWCYKWELLAGPVCLLKMCDFLNSV